jgi:hypothetical protein
MRRLVFLLLFIFSISVSFANGQKNQTTPAKLWQEVDDSALQQRLPERIIIPNSYRTFALDKTAMQNVLRQAPMEFSDAARNNSSVVVTIPMPDGKLARFSIEESPIFAPELAAKHPEIKTYRGQGIDDPTAIARFDLMPSGFHSIILSASGTILLDPYAKNDTRNYISYFKSDAEKTGEFVCNFKSDTEQLPAFLDFLPDAPNVTTGANLRTYRLALAANGEYTNVFRQAGDTDAQARARALEQMVLIMNRVNGVYEREFAVRMVMIPNEDSIIYTDPATDPYTNTSPSTLLNENTTNLNAVIGTANFDIGHVFTTGGGGIATLNGPCGAGKARGVTGLPNPVGDPFAIDYVAHEMGHQFGAPHTFNGTVSGCGGSNRSASDAYEPGSAVTIMGYAGLCGNQNLAGSSIDTFHVKSIERIVTFTTLGIGSTCGLTTPTGNNAPSVFAPGTFNIPKQTPFYLTAIANDPDGDSVTYDWQEYDNGGATGTTAVPNSDSDGTARPIFRPYLPTTNPTRTYPSLQFILNNANVPPNTNASGRLTGEMLPSITRTMNFQVIARDNRANGGGVNTATATLNVDGTSGPFIITAPDTNVTWAGNSTQTVTWNVANTNNTIVNAQNVKISLSTDGGSTFPTVIAASTANDGSETITVPNINTNFARIKIEAVGNVFFDISGANFTITSNVNPPTNRPLFDYDGDGKADISVFRRSNGIWYLLNSLTGFGGLQFGASTDRIVPADYDGDGKTDIAVYRDGTWFIQQTTAGFRALQFGNPTDIPVPTDFNGDGKADVAVYRPSIGTWLFEVGSATQFGISGDVPMPGDFDGDGKSDLALFRPSNGVWYILGSTQGFYGVQFGAVGDKLVPADYDGDGKTDLAVFRPSNSTWYINRSQLGSTVIQFGTSTDIPTPADYDGDGKVDIAVYRNDTWFIQRSTAGFTGVQFGALNDQPVSNAYVR